MDSPRDSHTRAVERSVWWMRSEMGLRDAGDAPGPGAPGRGRCDVHAVGHARGAAMARFGGFLLATASALALMLGARPAEAQVAPSGPPVAQIAGAGLGALSVAGFVAGRVIERRTRYHVWLQVETRAITESDVHGLVDAVAAARSSDDRGWKPDQAWLVAPAVAEGAVSLAREHGVRCFVQQRGHTREV